MDPFLDRHRRPSGRTVAVAEGMTLLAFVASLFLPSALRGLGLAVLVLAALAALTSAAVWARRDGASVSLAVVVVAGSLGLLGSIVYLNSIADEPSAIPLGGVGVLFLSLVALVVSGVLLLRR